MPAIVRSGARRLAASAVLQRAAAAGALVQPSGPFPARFMSSTKQMKKGQLYDLIAKYEPTDRQNMQLLRSLSKQIKPRPNDWRWRLMRAVEVTKEVVESSIPLTGCLLTCLAMLELQLLKNARKEKQQVDAAKGQNLAHA